MKSGFQSFAKKNHENAVFVSFVKRVMKTGFLLFAKKVMKSGFPSFAQKKAIKMGFVRLKKDVKMGYR